MGRYLEIAERAISKVANPRSVSTGMAVLPPPASVAIPAGALLLAPRYNGDNKPLASVPKCWCCGQTYILDRLQESKGQPYAWFKPGCGCLDARTCYRCFLCREHCRCQQTQERPQNPENTVLEAATETESNCWHCGAEAGETGRCDCSTCGQAGPGASWQAGDCRVCVALREREAKQ
jgi:hypothetical protein